MTALSLRPLAGIGEIEPGQDLGEKIATALGSAGATPGLVLAVAHTVVSKAEGAIVELGSVAPGERALQIAAEQSKDPRLTQVVLDQSLELLRVERGVMISRTRHGFVCANAGVDASNAGGADRAILLPEDPDRSARTIRARLASLLDAPPPAVLITDSFGRAWRHGQVDVAIGAAGLQPLDDWRGRIDADGMELRATWLAVADAVAGAADLARAKDSREPVIVVEGLDRFVTAENGPGAAALLRPLEEDMFR